MTSLCKNIIIQVSFALQKLENKVEKLYRNVTRPLSTFTDMHCPDICTNTKNNICFLNPEQVTGKSHCNITELGCPFGISLEKVRLIQEQIRVFLEYIPLKIRFSSSRFNVSAHESTKLGSIALGGVDVRVLPLWPRAHPCSLFVRKIPCPIKVVSDPIYCQSCKISIHSSLSNSPC